MAGVAVASSVWSTAARNIGRKTAVKILRNCSRVTLEESALIEVLAGSWGSLVAGKEMGLQPATIPLIGTMTCQPHSESAGGAMLKNHVPRDLNTFSPAAPRGRFTPSA